MSKILTIAAHPDDELLGLGATIRKHVNSGHTADCIILGEGATSRYSARENANDQELSKLKDNSIKAGKIIGYENIYFSSLPDNRFDSVDLLDIIKELEKYIEKIKPEIIFTHHFGDLNVDHRLTFEATLTATRPFGKYCVKEIYCFETPSSTEWSFGNSSNLFKPNVFIDVENTIHNKLKAMECYISEIREYPHPRSKEALEVISKRWGTVIGKKYAEAFELIRKVE